MVRLGKTHLFDRTDMGVYISPAAVGLEGVDMKDEGASALLPGLKGCVDGKPLVGVDDIEGVPPRDGACRFPVSPHLVEEIGTVRPRACQQAVIPSEGAFPDPA
jgi:hypothetical protein